VNAARIADAANASCATMNHDGGVEVISMGG
jgi:hypothetical protein